MSEDSNARFKDKAFLKFCGGSSINLSAKLILRKHAALTSGRGLHAKRSIPACSANVDGRYSFYYTGYFHAGTHRFRYIHRSRFAIFYPSYERGVNSEQFRITLT